MKPEDNLENLLYDLDFCSCGTPEEAALFILAGLQHINKLVAARGLQHEEFGKWYDRHEEHGLEIFGSQGVETFFYYWTEAADLTEHGGSVPGWLTDKGKEVLARLLALQASGELQG